MILQLKHYISICMEATMELYDLASPVENMLAAKADIMRSPLGGTIELLPLCNMSCKMCYIHQSKEQMNKTGTMLSCDQWLRIADEAKKVAYCIYYLRAVNHYFIPNLNVYIQI